jgi:hypothetical protein
MMLTAADHGNRPAFELRALLAAHKAERVDALPSLPGAREALLIAIAVLTGRDYIGESMASAWLRAASRKKVAEALDLAIGVAEDQESSRLEPTRAIRLYRAARGGK